MDDIPESQPTKCQKGCNQKEWSNTMLKLRLDMSPGCLGGPFPLQTFHQLVIDQNIIGLVPHHVYNELIKYRDVFETDRKGQIIICNQINTAEEITLCFEKVVKHLRMQNVFHCLKGWRNERFKISSKFDEPSLFELERSACHLFGVAQYGVHLNGYYVNGNGEYLMWIGVRSESKATWPGLLDNMVGGGIISGDTVWETLVKESKEEASVPVDLIKNAQSAGSISYWREDSHGLSYEVEFVYDLEVEEDFVPMNADGEMSGFKLMSIDEMKKEIYEGEFKPNCGLVVLDFMVRHGLIGADQDPNYCQLITLLHEPFDKMINASI